MTITLIAVSVASYVLVFGLVVGLCEAGARADRKRWQLEELAAADEDKALGTQDDLFIWAFLAGK